MRAIQSQCPSQIARISKSAWLRSLPSARTESSWTASRIRRTPSSVAATAATTTTESCQLPWPPTSATAALCLFFRRSLSDRKTCRLSFSERECPTRMRSVRVPTYYSMAAAESSPQGTTTSQFSRPARSSPQEKVALSRPGNPTPDSSAPGRVARVGYTGISSLMSCAISIVLKSSISSLFLTSL